jgi:hypothetical protein
MSRDKPTTSGIFQKISRRSRANGGVPRAWAEGFARLDPDRPPVDVPPHRWRRFIDDVGLFLDSPFCAVAAAFGWTAFDLFVAE